MYIMVVDTETCDINKCFCYDVGYIIYDTEANNIVARKHFVIEQIWHNIALFHTAYYSEKRPLYINLMRTRQATLEKWGYVMQEMIRDVKKFNITDAYAYNSNFDEKVFAFNCDWFKTQNPFDNVAIHDIWGYASEVITNTNEYKLFCEQYQRFTESENYSGSAETVYQFITNNSNFTEQHMGLHDAEIELSILIHCVRNLNCKWNEDYKVVKILTRLIQHPFVIKVNNVVIYQGNYIKKYIRKDNFNFTEA